MRSGVYHGSRMTSVFSTLWTWFLALRALVQLWTQNSRTDKTLFTQNKSMQRKSKSKPQVWGYAPPDTTRRRRPTIPPHPDARRLTLRRNWRPWGLWLLYSKSLNCNLGIFDLLSNKTSISPLFHWRGHISRRMATSDWAGISLILFANLPAFDIPPFPIELAPSSTRSCLTYKEG